MIAGTDATNFEVNLGGWNCRHQFFGVSDFMVPEEVRKKLEEKRIFAASKNESGQALSAKIEANRKEYERLLTDDNYTDVRFNPETGALSAIHKEHRFDTEKGIFGIERGEYERISLDVLYEQGNKVVLGSEKQEYKIKVPDGDLNNKKFDIKGVEGIGKNNIINNIKNTNKKGADAIVLYYHNNKFFSEKQLRDSYDTYYRNSKSKRIQDVYYIVGRKLYTLK